MQSESKTRVAAETPARPRGEALEAAQLVSQLGNGYLMAAAVRTVLELRIPDLVESGTESIDDLAVRANVTRDALLRVMRALAAIGVFRESRAGQFQSTTASRLLCDKPHSMRAWSLWMTSGWHLYMCDELLNTVRTGRSATQQTTGLHFFDFLATEPALGAAYHEAMNAGASRIVRAVLAAYDFRRFSMAIDVGGGHGQLMLPLLAQYPRMRGIIFDRADVVAGAIPVVEAAGAKDRCEVRSGDFFVELPEGGDVYLLKHILHDWDDVRALQILKNVRRALGHAGGKLTIIESVSTEEADLGFVDLHLLLTLGSHERTLAQFKQLLADAKFNLVRSIPVGTRLCLLECEPT